MKHFLFLHRPMFSEARLLRMAPPPGEVPGAKDAPPAAEAKAEGVDPKAAFRKAQERLQASGAKLRELSAKLKALEDLKAKADAGKELTADELEKHGVGDEDGNDAVDADDVAKSAKKVEDEMKVHQQSLDAASVETDQHLSAIESKGPGGVLDAAFMRVDSVMKNPNASIGEKIAAVLMAFKGVQDLFKGLTSPSTASPKVPGEAKESTLQGKRESVRQMMKDAGKTKVGDLLTAKETNVTALKGQKGVIEATVATSRQNVVNDQNAVVTAKSALEQDKENPTKQKAVRDAEAKVVQSDAAMKAAEQQLASLNADIAKAEADVKMIKEVKDGTQKQCDDYNQNNITLIALYQSLAKDRDATPILKEKVEAIVEVLKNYQAEPDDNGVDISLKIPADQMGAFMQPFADAGIDPKSLQIGPTGTITNIDAYQQGMDKLRANLQAADWKNKK